MSTPRRIGRQSALVLLALMLGAGCSNMPTGPRPGLDSAFAPDRSPAAPAALLPSPVAVPIQEGFESRQTIIGTLGGTVRAGNFTVVIPPLALSGTATITVTQPDRDKPFVQLRISPSSANKFRSPVTLIADASPMDGAKLPLAKIDWFNPATGQWEAVQGSNVSLLSTTVSAPLWHFSDYRVGSGGKAGW
jgi:hypothetical protein